MARNNNLGPPRRVASNRAGFRFTVLQLDMSYCGPNDSGARERHPQPGDACGSSLPRRQARACVCPIRRYRSQEPTSRRLCIRAASGGGARAAFARRAPESIPRAGDCMSSIRRLTRPLSERSGAAIAISSASCCFHLPSSCSRPPRDARNARRSSRWNCRRRIASCTPWPSSAPSGLLRGGQRRSSQAIRQMRGRPRLGDMVERVRYRHRSGPIRPRSAAATRSSIRPSTARTARRPAEVTVHREIAPDRRQSSVMPMRFARPCRTGRQCRKYGGRIAGSVIRAPHARSAAGRKCNHGERPAQESRPRTCPTSSSCSTEA